MQNVGLELRGLLASVDELMPTLPLWSHREIELTHKVLGKDMAKLVQAMKLAQKYSHTTVEADYRKGMLQAAHVLVIDAKNLLDAVDSVKLKVSNGDPIVLAGLNQNSPLRSPVSPRPHSQTSSPFHHSIAARQ